MLVGGEGRGGGWGKKEYLTGAIAFGASANFGLDQ